MYGSQIYRSLPGISLQSKGLSKMSNGIKNLGTPDLMILFTNTISHKMVRCALSEAKENTTVARCHSSSIAALKGILDEHTGGAACQKN